MPELDVLAPEAHRDKYWRSPDNLLFAARDMLVPLGLQEITHAVMAMPIAFARTNDSYHLVGLQGFLENHNLFVSPDGRWLTHYIPAHYRCYPFGLGTADDGRRVLCFRRDSGLMTDVDTDKPTVHRFFEDDDALSPKVDEVLRILTGLNHSGTLFRNTADLLNKHGLIVPWEIDLPGEAGAKKLTGLFQIDEPALYALEAEAFAELRQQSALVVAFCQLLSTQHIKDMVILMGQHRQLSQSADTTGFKLHSGEDSGTLSFDNL